MKKRPGRPAHPYPLRLVRMRAYSGEWQEFLELLPVDGYERFRVLSEILKKRKIFNPILFNNSLKSGVEPLKRNKK